jgi:CRISPR/Cas system-associated exonuclease Cas4 (RecB family)
MNKLREIGDGFSKILDEVIVEEYNDVYSGDMTKFRPSSLSGCKRKIYWDMTVGNKEHIDSPNLIGILESGTTRHEILQNYVMLMDRYYDVKWIDTEDYIEKEKIPNVEIIKKCGNETRCLNTKYNISFMVDGILMINGNYFLLEVKTETFFKYTKHNEPHLVHQVQADSYALCLGLSNIIFLYENRDNCSKKSYYYESTEDSKQQIVSKIESINNHLKKEQIPKKASDVRKCKYCPYKKKCKEEENGKEK